MKYDQAYYSYIKKGTFTKYYSEAWGWGLPCTSNPNLQFRNSCENAAKSRADTSGLGYTEYFEYDHALKNFIYMSVKHIPSVAEMKGATNNVLTQILVPTEELSLEDPSNYLRNMDYPEIDQLVAGMDDLEQREIPDYEYNYHNILRKYHFSAEKEGRSALSRLAVLLAMECLGFLKDEWHKIIFLIDEKEYDVFEAAREITWLMHSWIPHEIFGKTMEKLRQNLGYCVSGNTSKACLLFIPMSKAHEIRMEFTPKNHFILLDQNYNYVEVISQKNLNYDAANGAKFYYALAKCAQKSAEAVRDMYAEVIGGKKIRMHSKLYKEYGKYRLNYLDEDDVNCDLLYDPEIVKMFENARKGDKEALKTSLHLLKIVALHKDDMTLLDSKEDFFRFWDLILSAYEGKLEEETRGCVDDDYGMLFGEFLNLTYRYCNTEYLKYLAIIQEHPLESVWKSLLRDAWNLNGENISSCYDNCIWCDVTEMIKKKVELKEKIHLWKCCMERYGIYVMDLPEAKGFNRTLLQQTTELLEQYS